MFIVINMLRIISHFDMDAFFAAIEERDHPRFKGRAIVVGADPAGGSGRGVVSTANYKAREYGIRSALPISQAWKFSEVAERRGGKSAIFLPVDMSKYARVSGEIMAILRRSAPIIEEASIDEAYADLSFTGSFKKAEKLCRKIKKEIFGNQALTVSVGLGPNKLIAKIASDFKKPDGLTMVGASEAAKFLEPLPIRKIPGIGPKTEELLARKDIKIVRDLLPYLESDLAEWLGKWGRDIYKKIRGEDDAPIITSYGRASIGEQETFSEDSRDPNFILERLKDLCGQVLQNFKSGGYKNFKTITVTVRFGDFETKNRSHTIQPSGSRQGKLFGAPPVVKPNPDELLFFEAARLILPFFDQRENPGRKSLRLIGVRLEGLL